MPEIRFPEFEEEWTTYKLGDICKFSKGKGISKKDIAEKGTPCIRYGELYTQYDELISETVSRTQLPLNELVLSEENDIIIPSTGETAIDISQASCINKDNIAIGGDINILKTQEDGVFLSYYLNYIKNDIAKMAQGISVIHLYSDQLKSLTVNIPSHEEQRKISKLLLLLNKRIESMEKKYHTLLQTKDNITRNLFCDGDNSKPLLNFNTEKWLNITLDEIGTTFSGLSGKNKDDFGVGSSSFVPYKAIFNSEIIDVNLLEKVKIGSSEKQNQIKKNDILFTSSSETPEEVAMTSIFLNDYEKCYLNSFSFGYRVTSDFINPVFLNYYLRSPMLRKEFYKIAQGSTRYNISKREILKLSIKYPSIETQEKIVSFILNINNHISNLKKRN